MWKIITLIFSINVLVACGSSKLISLVTLYRHGARTPIDMYTKDPYQHIASTIWPDGLGQLTTVGVLQQYKLGQWIRERYNDFIPARYNHTFQLVLSSNFDRCLMSAAANLAGLYPPKGDQVWMKNFHWQPIPIHTRPQNTDLLIVATIPCKKYDRLFKELLSSTFYLSYIEERKHILSYLSYHTGNNVTTPTDVMLIHDNLSIKQENNFKLPAWAKRVFPHLTYDLAAMYFALPAYTTPLAKLKSGPLIDYVVKFFENATTNPEKSKKYLMLSGHDTTLVWLLSSLGVYDFHTLEYASTIIFELRRNENFEFVNIYFKNSTTLRPIKLNMCSFDCRFDSFKKIVEPIRTSETAWKKECADVQ